MIQDMHCYNIALFECSSIPLYVLDCIGFDYKATFNQWHILLPIYLIFINPTSWSKNADSILTRSI